MAEIRWHLMRFGPDDEEIWNVILDDDDAMHLLRSCTKWEPTVDSGDGLWQILETDMFIGQFVQL